MDDRSLIVAAMSDLTPFSTLLSTRTLDTGARTVSFVIPADWQQGRTTFGGLIAALAVQAMRDIAGSAWDATVSLRALQTSFIGPVASGPVDVAVEVLREGKHVRQVQALVRQAGQTAAHLLGVFGSPRDTVVPPMAPPQPAVARSPDDSIATPYIAGVTPEFTRHFDFRWGEGTMPYSGADSWHSRLHLRLKSEVIHPELLTVLLADSPPSPVISRFTRPAPASSVSWELELRPVAAAEQGNAWWRVDTDVIAAAGGYVNQVSKLWTPSGELASIGYQVVAVYG
jgi:acyl-CoA thioesterase